MSHIILFPIHLVHACLRETVSADEHPGFIYGHVSVLYILAFVISILDLKIHTLYPEVNLILTGVFWF